MSDQLISVPLSKLQRSSDNIRKTEATSDIEELAASIEAHGLIQNLTVRPASSANGGSAKATSNDHYRVIAGGRRLAALKLLAKRKRLLKDHPVLCRVLSDEDAAEVSLAENIVRAPLHPADQYEAFSKLHADGLGVEDIAARFGITPTVVKQRLKLAAVSPKLMEVYRAGDMTLDQLVAFTITDDHEAQERVWFDESLYDRHPRTLRSRLTSALVDGSDRRARFIGAEAYEAAGGVVIRDLFCADDGGYFADSQLLDRLVEEKLDNAADQAKAEGWAWVEACQEIDYGYQAGFRRLSPTEVPLSEEDQAKAAALSSRYDELVDQLEEVGSPEIEQELDQVSSELDALARLQRQWTPEQMAMSGIVISLDYRGDLNVIEGLVREEPSQKDGKASRNEGDKEGKGNRSKGEFSEKLLEDLSAHRTAALRECLAAQSDVALTALLHALSLQVFYDHLGATCVDIRSTCVDLRPSAEGIAESKATAAMAKRHQGWLKKLPKVDGLFTWLAKQSDRTRSELLAYCVGSSVNAIRKRHDPGAEDRLRHADPIAAAVSLDMADWWEPTKDQFLSRVSKAQITAAVSEAVSEQAAANIASMKKEALAARAEELLVGKRWLPKPLRAPITKVKKSQRTNRSQ